MGARLVVLGVSVFALATCVTVQQTAAPGGAHPAASEAGGERTAVATPAGPRRTRVFVPFPDCTGNDPRARGAGGIVEQCPCKPDTPLVCCQGRAFTCTTLGWAQAADVGACGPEGATAPGVPNGTVAAAHCRTCRRGVEGCWCGPDRTCEGELACMEGLCGRRIE